MSRLSTVGSSLRTITTVRPIQLASTYLHSNPIALPAQQKPLCRSASRQLSTSPNSEGSHSDSSKEGPYDKFGSVPFWKNGVRIQWIFGGLAGLGALITIYGLLEFYSTLTTWPKAVRKPLRAALKAKLRQDYIKSELFFREALATALEIGPNGLEPDPLLKISGIYVELANVLELKGQRVAAFTELRNALNMFGTDPLLSAQSVGRPESEKGRAGQWAGEQYSLTEKDHIRSVGLYQKLGQLALEIATTPRSPTYDSVPSSGATGPSIKTWDGAAEHYLSSALTAMLRLGLSTSSSSPGVVGEQGQVIAGRDINLPSGSTDPHEIEADLDPNQGGRVDKRGLGITMESLSEVYARKGQYDLAGQLLLQAVSLLLPPGSKDTPAVRDRCQGEFQQFSAFSIADNVVRWILTVSAALLMTTISSHASQPKTPQAIKVSKSWSLRSLQLSEQALRESEGGGTDSTASSGQNDETPLEVSLGICKRARSVGLYNLGMLAEMEKDYSSALNFFNKALSSAREAAFPEGKREAMAAIRRIQSIPGAQG